jgi:leader peptidase (prepilin peptidase)/N-methyltransferase
MDLSGAAGAILYVGVFLAGLAVGSFLNAVIYRLPREGLSVWSPRRSICPSCRAQLGWRDNIPLLSYILLRGRCRRCQSPISARYPLVELLSAILAVSLLAKCGGLSPSFFIYWYFVCCLAAIAFIDAELMVIPDLLVIPTCLLGAAASVLIPNPELAGGALWDRLIIAGWNGGMVSLCGALAGFALGFLSLWASSRLYKVWRGRDGLGSGDPPLMGMIGVFLGWRSIFPILFLASLIGLLSVFISLAAGRLPARGGGPARVPFGPFLVLAALFWLFYGERVIRWYISLFTVPQ